MTRHLPYPIASTSLLALWLLLNQSFSLGQILLGMAVALVGGWSLTLLKLTKPRPRRLRVIARLTAEVVADIIRSNVAVARIVLGLGRKQRTPGFVDIPLELRDPYGLAMLACIITSTPGTLWVDFNETSGILTIHVLDLVEESEWIRTIKARYEARLLEIFE
ncbi:Na+/H+ antiporter subunit E [Pseudorhodoplanes sp.]|jgi:multicomponent K+:H+ antiporter subunit E|uniref:Na+/H+ antiporter subunit E n=1 Tax=Pseudorhodoplanes sp. TaxID=1934341 RepID=UPI003D12A497